jgi:hypothetical protein
MKTYRMIVKTEAIGTDGRSRVATERVPHIASRDLDSRREAARQSAPRGATRTIRVVPEI